MVSQLPNTGPKAAAVCGQPPGSNNARPWHDRPSGVAIAYHSLARCSASAADPAAVSDNPVTELKPL